MISEFLRDDLIMKPTKHRPPESVIIKPTQNELIDVDPSVIDVMKARLQGQEFYKTYDVSDRITGPAQIKLERKKLKKVFNTYGELIKYFSSIQSTKKALKAMHFYKVDRVFLTEYADQKSNGSAIDEVDFYAWFLFNKPLVQKCDRAKNYIYFLGLLDAAQHLKGVNKSNFEGKSSLKAAHDTRKKIESYINPLFKLRSPFINQKLWPLLDEYQKTDFSSLGQLKILRQWEERPGEIQKACTTPLSPSLSANHLLHTFYTIPL